MTKRRPRPVTPTATLTIRGFALHLEGDASIIGRAIAGALMGAAEVRTCRSCGCTEYDACEGGYSWVEADLCSACEEPRVLPAKKRGRR